MSCRDEECDLMRMALERIVSGEIRNLGSAIIVAKEALALSTAPAGGCSVEKGGMDGSPDGLSELSAVEDGSDQASPQEPDMRGPEHCPPENEVTLLTLGMDNKGHKLRLMVDGKQKWVRLAFRDTKIMFRAQEMMELMDRRAFPPR